MTNDDQIAHYIKTNLDETERDMLRMGDTLATGIEMAGLVGMYVAFGICGMFQAIKDRDDRDAYEMGYALGHAVGYDEGLEDGPRFGDR